MLTAQQSGSVTSFDVSKLHTNSSSSVKQGQHNPAVAGGGGAGAANANANAAQSAAQLVAAVGLAATASSMSNYKIVNTIGRGNFGVCHLCECLDTRNPAHLGKMFVIKQINMSQLSASEKEGAVQEVKLLSELHHPFIVGYKESFLEGEILNIVMTYCEGGDLTTLIKQQEGKYFPEEQILDWFIQLCLSLRYIHQRRIIHRDLKSQNIFLTKRFNVRLGDFGIARVLNGTNELAMSVVGTPYSMSPEVCENKPYSFKSDIWALGCVLYELCTLKHAFDAHNLLGLVWKIVSESYPPIPSHYTPELTDLVGKMLSKDPAGRPSIDAILEMPFIRARLHSQIRAKMNLKSKQAAAQAAGKQKAAATGTVSPAATQNGQLPAATKPRSQSSATPTTLPASLGAASRSNSTTATPTTPNGGANNAGPTGTLRSNAPRPTLDVDRANGALPSGGSVERLTSPSAHNLPQHSPSVLSSQNRASSAIAANRSANAATPSYNLNHSSANFSSQSPQSVNSARSANDGAPMLSPSDRLSMRKKAEADARARELTEAARAAAGDRMYAAQRNNAEFRGGAQRPTSGLPSSSSHNTPSYASAFEDDTPSSSNIPPRQRSAGNSRPDPYEGRTPTRSTAMDYPAAFNSTVTAASNLSLDDRPIKSSGAYRLGVGGTKAMSPAAIQAQRSGGGSTPPSAGSSNHSFNVRTTARLGDDDDSALGSSRARPSSVSSSGSSRVTRVHDDDEGEESYSGDDFDPLSEEEEEILHEFERTYTLPQQRSAAAASGADRPISSTPSSAANRGVGSKHIPSSLASPTASNSAYSSNVAMMNSHSSSATTTTNSEPPSISDKRAAIKEKCLRKMSESEFTEVYSFIKQRQREAESAKDGSKDITADELTNKFGERNKDVLFLIEQYVFLSSILDRNSANSNGGASGSSSSSANGADVRKRSSSGASVISPLKSASSGTPARSPSAKPVGSPPSASKPTSATSRIKK